MKETLQQMPAHPVNEPEHAPEQSAAAPTSEEPFAGYQSPPPTADFQWPQGRYWQPYSAPGDISPFEMTSMGMRARTAGLLCYLFSWVGGLVFFLLERENRFVRFHAAQSLLFFGAMSVLGAFCSFFPFAFFGLGGIVGLVSFIGWIVLMVAAYRGRYYKLPLLGEYAEQLANRMGR